MDLGPQPVHEAIEPAERRQVDRANPQRFDRSIDEVGRIAHGFSSFKRRDGGKALGRVIIYSVHLRTRKSPGGMMRKLSVTLSQSVLHLLSTSLRRKPSTVSQNSLHTAIP
jgi:hypothetical protein